MAILAFRARLVAVEDIDNTDYNWFMNSMSQFSGNNVSKMPEDHHELMAICAPRALYVTANPGWIWLSNPSCYVCSEACQPIYNALGIADRFGFSLVGGHTHCVVPDSQIPEIESFVKKFLLGNTTVNTNIADTYYNIDLSRWITWTAPSLSNGPSSVEWASLIYPSNLQKDLDTTSITIKWNKVQNVVKYIIQLSTDPTFASINKMDSTTTDTTKTFSSLLLGKRYYWRVNVQSPVAFGLWSYIWSFTTFIPLPATPQLVGATPYPGQPGSVTFKWNKAQYADQYNIQLAHDQNFVSIFYSDSTTSDTVKTVTGLTDGFTYYWRVQAKNVEGLSPWSVLNYTVDVKDVNEGEIPTEYSLSQNYPNPFNPTTTFSFGLPMKSYVSLKVFDFLGREIAIIVSEEMSAGYYSRQWNANKFSSGLYFYQLSVVPSARRDLVPTDGRNGRAGSFVETKKLLFLK